MTQGVPGPLANGSHIGPYEIVGWLGAGGMGEVYRARDARLGREVAIKVIRETFATDTSRLHRFEQEARAAGQLNHPNILAVFDIGAHAGAPYIVAELLEGESLRSRLGRGALAERKALDCARQIAEGLAAAHDKGIVHRDLKPENIFITSDGRIKILDFGIAKLTRPGDDAARPTGFPTETEPGMVVGTPGYMSPEQVRGEAVDARSDLFSVGTILYEMLAGRAPFTRATAADTMAAILKEDAAPITATAASPGPGAALERIIARCLEKARETRFQSARDLAFALEVLSGTTPTAVPAVAEARRWRTALGIAVVVLSLSVAVASWLTRGQSSPPVENRLADARVTRLTDWEGMETHAEISPDGRFVAFVADRAGQFDVWLKQVGIGDFQNLTENIPPRIPPGPFLRSHGFSGDGAEVWLSAGGDPSRGPKLLVPLVGGAPRAFLSEGDAAPAWSPDGTRLVSLNNIEGDPLSMSDGTGANARPILAAETGVLHNHNPVWSPDGQWIYFLRGLDANQAMEVWRLPAAGGSPEQLTDHRVPMNFLAPLDARTLLYVARARDGSGPWLWTFDVASRVPRRVNWGLEQYTSVAASRDGRRVVATVANPTASLWRVPLLAGRPADDRDAQPYRVPTVRALAPRFGPTSLFYLSARGTADGLWRVENRQASEVMKGADGALSEPPAVSRDGRRVVVVVRQEGQRRLMIMSADGTNARTLAASIDIEGAPGQGFADWSPDGAWIAAGGSDDQGQALFNIPVDGGTPVRLVRGAAVNPVWSPDGNVIVYSGPFVAGQVSLLGVRPDGSPVKLPDVRVRPGAYRFLPNGTGLVYLRIGSPELWLLDLATGNSRQLTRLSDLGRVQTFDIEPDGRHIVFDRLRANSDIVLIDLPAK